MESFTNYIETHLVPVVSKITNLRYFQALRNGFMVIMPLTIIGSIFMLITDFPLAGYPEFMASIFGADWASFIEPAYRATFNMMGFVFVGTMAYKLAESYEMDSLTCMVLALVAFIVVTPTRMTTEGGETLNKVLSMTWLGTQGVVTAIFTAIITLKQFASV